MKFLTAAICICFIICGCKKDSLSHPEVIILSNPSPGEILVSPYSFTASGNLMLLNEDGNTITQKTVPYAALNFKKWEVNNKIRYTYMEYDPYAFQIAQGTITPCTAVVLDENFNEIKRVRLVPYNGRTAADPDALDSHEFIYLDDNHFITLSYYQKTVSNIPLSLNPVTNCKVVTPIIQEVLNGDVVWEWDGSNYPELYRQSLEGNAFSNGSVVHDYVHMNSMVVDSSDGNLICSMRNLNQIIKIDRTNGNIMWRLGGTNSDFPMTAGMKFLRQHYATLTDNGQTLLLYDNGEATERPYTRVDEFQLDVASKTINSFKSFTLPGGIFSQFMGSVQKISDRYFIGCGSVPEVMEVNYNTGTIDFELKLPETSYRAFKYQ